MYKITFIVIYSVEVKLPEKGHCRLSVSVKDKFINLFMINLA